MTPVKHLKPTVLSNEPAISTNESEYVLNIGGVYQDAVTRDWAVQTCFRAAQLAGEERMQHTWHDVNALSDPANLLNAVRAALVADVIAVSVHPAKELPVDLYVWVDAWM